MTGPERPGQNPAEGPGREDRPPGAGEDENLRKAARLVYTGQDRKREWKSRLNNKNAGRNSGKGPRTAPLPLWPG